MLDTARHREMSAVHGHPTITVTTTREHATITVTGEVDLSITTRLHERLTEELQLRPAALIVDLTDVTFCSSGGLSVLLDTVTTAHARGIACAIIATHRAVLRPIRIMQLDRVLPIHPDRDDAEVWLSILARLR